MIKPGYKIQIKIKGVDLFTFDDSVINRVNRIMELKNLKKTHTLEWTVNIETQKLESPAGDFDAYFVYGEKNMSIAIFMKEIQLNVY